ncbi:hypothetical protein V6N11_069513 [Hibiscus sabdariffa]|uniref:Uncharacterized protein n=1 Tax=Hibiscus sabdariffa TaxID=183260 RepID=A0ABR2Q2Y8_9ROSI
MPWNSLMDAMMRKLHSQGTSIDDIVAVLRRTPTHPRIIQAIKSAHELGCDLKIVSDVNVFFIDTISEHHGLRECFSEIHTNPSFVDEEGRIRIFPLHDLGKHPHGCHHPCPPNMCKGIVIERIQASLSAMDEKKTIVYMGLICKNRKLIKAGVCEWSNAEEFEHVLLHLISKISIDKSNTAQPQPQPQLYLYSDCKLGLYQDPLCPSLGHKNG